MKSLRNLLLATVAIVSVAFGTVPSSTTYVQYTLTTNPQTLTVPFVFQNASDLLVLDSKASPPVTLTLSSDYTVSGGSGSTGSISTRVGGANGVAVGDVITISRRVPLTQATVFANGGPVTAAMIGQAFDKVTEITQQLNLVGANSLQFQGDEQMSGVLPRNARKNALLAFDSLGRVWFPTTASIVTTLANPLSVISIAALKLLPVSGYATGVPCEVLGYYQAVDGGGGLYVWNSTSTATDNGGSIIAATGVATGRWLLQSFGAVNARQFGAKGDGATDDAAAINAAIASCEQSQKTVFFPAGIYMVGSPIVLPSGGSNWGIELVGVKNETKYEPILGAAATILRAVASSGIASVVNASGVYYSTIRNLVIDGNNTALVGYSNGYQDQMVDSAVIQCVTAGVDLNGLTNNTKLVRTSLLLNGIGLRSIGTNTTDFFVDKCQIRQNTGDGVYIANAFTARFSETIFEQNGGDAVNLKAANNVVSQVYNVSFESCWFEGNTSYAAEVGGTGSGFSRYVTFLRCFFNAGTKCANIGNAIGVTFDGCHFLDSPTTAGYFVVDAAAYYVQILNQPDVLGSASLNITGTGAANVIKFSASFSGGMQVTQPLLIKGSPTTLTTPAGYIGEVLQSTIEVGSAVSLTTATITNLTSLTLTPGSWRITGTINFHQGATTTYVALVAYNSTTINGGGATTEEAFSASAASANVDGTLTLPTKYIDVPADGNVVRYLNALAYFSVSTMTAYGTFTAERYK